MGVDEYQDYMDELMAAAGQVNARYGTSEWEPVRVLVGDNYLRAVAGLQLYDVLLVNSIADGISRGSIPPIMMRSIRIPIGVAACQTLAWTLVALQ